MDFATNLEQFLQQVTEAQRQVFKGFTSAIPGMGNSQTQGMGESFDHVLKFQEQVVSSSLEFQTLVTRLALESQKQLWQNYFNMLRSK